MKHMYDSAHEQIETLAHDLEYTSPSLHKKKNDFHHDDEDFYHLREDFHHEKHEHTCWKKAVSRESGFYPTCGTSGEQSGNYCYKKCEKGFTGVGPVCYQDCKNFGGVRPPPTPLSAITGLNLEDENEAVEDGLIPGMGMLKGMT